MDEKNWTNHNKTLPLKPLVEKIDAIIQELENLRRLVEPSFQKKEDFDIARDLFGALGKGTWEEYDFDLEWKSFGP